jgi:hypothetical protein
MAASQQLFLDASARIKASDLIEVRPGPGSICVVVRLLSGRSSFMWC